MAETPEDRSKTSSNGSSSTGNGRGPSTAPLPGSMEAILRSVGRKLADFLDASRVTFVEVDPDTRVGRVICHHHREEMPDIGEVHRIGDYFDAGQFKSLMRGESVVVNDVSTDPRTQGQQAAFQKNAVRSFVFSPYFADGQVKFGISVVKSTPYVWRGDQLALLRDVAEQVFARLGREQAEEKAAERKERFQLMADTVPQSIWVTDAEGRVEFLNRHWFEFSGTPPGQAKTAADIAERSLHPEDAAKVMTAFEKAMRAGEGFEVEQRNRAANGEYRWFLNRATPYRDPRTGAITKWFGVGVDIHDRKMADAALAEQRRLYESILNNTPDLAYLFDLDHRFTYANEGLLKLWGKTWDEAIGKTCLELGYEPWHAEMHDREIDHVVATGESIRGEVPFTGTNGRRIYDYIFSPVLDDEGRVTAVAGTTRDVTDYRKTQEELAASEERLRMSLEASRMGRFEWTSDGERATLSELSSEVFGLRPGQTIATSEEGFGILHPDDRERHRELITNAIENGVDYHTEFRVVRPVDGRVAWIEERGTVLRDAATGIVHIRGVHWDVTERKRVEKLLQDNAERQRFLLRLSDLIRPLAEPIEIQQAASSALRDHLNAARVVYAEVMGDDDLLFLTSAEADGVPNMPASQRFSDYEPSLLEEFKAGGISCRSDLANDPNISDDGRANYADAGINAWANASLVKGGRLAAVFSVHYPDAHEWPEEELNLIEEVAERIWSAVDRARAEQARSESESKLRAIYHGTYGYLGLLSPEGVVLDINRAALQFGSDTREDVVGRPFWEGMWWRNTPGAAERLREAIRLASLGEFVRDRVALRRESGDVTYFDFSLHPIRDGQGNVKYLVPEGRNITDQVTAESEIRFQANLLNSVEQAVIATDADGIVKYWNAFAEKLYGWTASEALGRSILELTPPDVSEGEAQAIMATLKEGRSWSGEFVVRRKDGSSFPAQIVDTPVLNPSGQVVTIIGVSSDISELKRREAHASFLAALSYRLVDPSTQDEIMRVFGEEVNRLTGASSCSFVDIDPERNFAEVTRTWHRDGIEIAGGYDLSEYFNDEFLTGLSSGEPRFICDVHDDPLVRNPAHFDRLGVAACANVPTVRGGRWQFVLGVYHDRPYQWRPDEEELLIEAASRVVTKLERLRAEDALRDSETRFRAFVTASSDVVYRMNADWSEMKQLDGRGLLASTTEPSADWMDRYIHPDDKGSVREAIREAISSKATFEFEHRVLRPDGSFAWTFSRAVPVLNDNGEIVEWIGAANDVTERRRAEEELQASQEELRRSEKLLQGSIDAMPDHIAILDRNGVILKVNRSWREFAAGNNFEGDNYGVGSNYLEKCAPPFGDATPCEEDSIKAMHGIRDVIDGKVPIFSLEYPCHSPTEQRWFQMRVTSFGTGENLRVVIAHENITSRHLTKLALSESEERYRTLFNSIDEGFCTIEMVFDEDQNPVDYRFIQVNDAFVRQTGLINAEGKLMRDFVPGHESYWFKVYGQVALTGEAIRFESEAKGMARWFDAYAFRVGDPSLRRVGVIFNDITRRKKIEQELVKAHAELEDRVQQRTIELAKANEALSVEIEERKELEKTRVELVHKIVTTQEDERQRISRDLHDQLGQRLTALRLKLSSLHDLTRDSGEVGARVARLQEIADTLDTEVSFLASQLRPTALDDLGLEDTLRSYANEWSAHYDTPLDFHSNFGPRRRLYPVVETHLYRIAQEALNNVIKHAKATHVAVLLEKTANGVVLVVEDNGAGLDPGATDGPKTGGGLGLVGMRERASLIGGEIEIESEAGRGTAIYVKVPDPAKPEQD